MVQAVLPMLVAVLLGMFAVAQSQSSGCQLNSRCVPLWYTYTENCIAYKCRRLLFVGTSLHYVFQIIRTRCSNAAGLCYEDRTPGLTIRNSNNELVQNCMCLVYGPGNVTFACP